MCRSRTFPYSLHILHYWHALKCEINAGMLRFHSPTSMDVGVTLVHRKRISTRENDTPHTPLASKWHDYTQSCTHHYGKSSIVEGRCISSFFSSYTFLFTNFSFQISFYGVVKHFDNEVIVFCVSNKTFCLLSTFRSVYYTSLDCNVRNNICVLGGVLDM